MFLSISLLQNNKNLLYLFFETTFKKKFTMKINTNLSLFVIAFMTLSILSCKQQDPTAQLEAIAQYIKDNPTDKENNAAKLLESAELYSGLGKYTEAANNLKRAVVDFPSSKSANCGAMLASLYNDKMNNSTLGNIINQCVAKGFPSFEGLSGIQKLIEGQPVVTEQINALGKNMYDQVNHRPIKEKAEDYISASELYASMMPSDTAGPDYLIKAGETARSLASTAAPAAKKALFDKAIKLYDWVIQKYPNHPKASQALFLKGFTLDEDLKDFAGAKEIYTRFLAKYPEDQFADDTQFLLDNIGVTDQQIIEKFEKKDKKLQ